VRETEKTKLVLSACTKRAFVDHSGQPEIPEQCGASLTTKYNPRVVRKRANIKTSYDDFVPSIGSNHGPGSATRRIAHYYSPSASLLFSLVFSPQDMKKNIKKHQKIDEAIRMP
jgi:hypothetical protein